MPSEADTCRQFVVPKLRAAGWDMESCLIAEQRLITDGCFPTSPADRNWPHDRKS